MMVPHLTNASYQISEGDDPAALLLAELQDSQKDQKENWN